MVYVRCLMIEEMKELDLFDDIEYKYIKHIINDDNDTDEIDVEIEDIDREVRDKDDICKTRFKFNIVLPVKSSCKNCNCNGILRVDLVKEYEPNSPYANMLCQHHIHYEDEEED